jgi:2-iminobutanoate/2-iminopropanoate deaminase
LAIPQDVGEQTTLAYANIAEMLAHFGADMSHVVEQSVFVTDMDAATAAREARKLAFPGGGLPVSTMVEGTRLAVPEANVEISVIARVDA